MNGQPESSIERSVALVTGATSGIGRAVALKLASEGFYVIVHDHDMTRGSATVEELDRGPE